MSKFTCPFRVVRPAWLQLGDRIYNAGVCSGMNGCGIFSRSNACLDRLFGKSSFLVQRKRLIHLAILVQSIYARDRLGENIGKRRNAARGA